MVVGAGEFQNTEERLAYQLGLIACELHQHGLMDAYAKTVEARDAVLMVLDSRNSESAYTNQQGGMRS